MKLIVRILGFVVGTLCFMAVLLAAMGAHLIDMNGLADIWGTASSVHMFNAAALVGLTALLAYQGSAILKWGAWLIVTGTIVFSGSIYFHVVSGFKIPVVTPVGGMIMMGGWILVTLAFLRRT